MLNSRMPDDDSNDITVIVVAALSLAGVFLLDVATPLGLAVWVFYLLPLGLCLLQTRPAIPLIAAALISVFALGGLFLSAPGAGAGAAFVVGASNRVIGGIVVWGLAWLAQRMIRARAELRETAWVREGEARVHRCLVEDNDPAKLAHAITTELCRYIGAAGGAMYTRDGDNLRLLGGYALGERMRARECIPVGEGLAGDVLEHGRTATLIGLPESYFELSSATGSADARALIVVPITAETRVCGVLEIAFVGNERWVNVSTLRRFSGLLEEVSDAVGMSLRAAQMRDDLIELLEETQRQGEELQAAGRFALIERRTGAAGPEYARDPGLARAPTGGTRTGQQATGGSEGASAPNPARSAGQSGSARAGQPFQVRVPRQHVARIAHTPE